MKTCPRKLYRRRVSGRKISSKWHGRLFQLFKPLNQCLFVSCIKEGLWCHLFIRVCTEETSVANCYLCAYHLSSCHLLNSVECQGSDGWWRCSWKSWNMNQVPWQFSRLHQAKRSLLNKIQWRAPLKDEFQRLGTAKFLGLPCLFACTCLWWIFAASQSDSAAAFLAIFPFQPARAPVGPCSSTTHTSKHWNAKTTLALCTDSGLTFKQNTL